METNNVVLKALVDEMNQFLINLQEEDDKEAKEILRQGIPEQEIDDVLERIFR